MHNARSQRAEQTNNANSVKARPTTLVREFHGEQTRAERTRSHEQSSTDHGDSSIDLPQVEVKLDVVGG